MGPLLPLAVLFGGLYYLDDSRKQVGEKKPDVKDPPRYSPGAVALVTDTSTEGVRVFKPETIGAIIGSLRLASVELLSIEGGPVGADVFRLVPLTPGCATADQAVRMALEAGKTVLGSLALSFADSGSPDHLLAIGNEEDVLRLANARSAFAVLASPMPVTAPKAEPVIVEEPAKPEPAKNKANGAAEKKPEVVEVKPEKGAEA